MIKSKAIKYDFSSYKNNGNVLRQIKKNTANKNSGVKRTKQNRLTLTSNCAVWKIKTQVD